MWAVIPQIIVCIQMRSIPAFADLMEYVCPLNVRIIFSVIILITVYFIHNYFQGLKSHAKIEK